MVWMGIRERRMVLDGRRKEVETRTRTRTGEVRVGWGAALPI